MSCIDKDLPFFSAGDRPGLERRLKDRFNNELLLYISSVEKDQMPR